MIKDTVSVMHDFNYNKDWIAVNYQMPTSTVHVFKSQIEAKDFIKKSFENKSVRIAFKINTDFETTKVLGLKAIKI